MVDDVSKENCKGAVCPDLYVCTLHSYFTISSQSPFTTRFFQTLSLSIYVYDLLLGCTPFGSYLCISLPRYASESISLACKYAYRNATPGSTLEGKIIYIPILFQLRLAIFG